MSEQAPIQPTPEDEVQMRHKARLRRELVAQLDAALGRCASDGFARVRLIGDEEWAKAQAEEEGEL